MSITQIAKEAGVSVLLFPLLRGTLNVTPAVAEKINMPLRKVTTPPEAIHRGRTMPSH